MSLAMTKIVLDTSLFHHTPCLWNQLCVGCTVGVADSPHSP